MKKALFFSCLVMVFFSSCAPREDEVIVDPVRIPSQTPPADNFDPTLTTSPFDREFTKGGIKFTGSDISIEPTEVRINSHDVAMANGRESVLSLPIKITNGSKNSIRMNLSHEWHGGIWPETDLWLASRERDTKDWEASPGYQTGETGTGKDPIVIMPNKTKSFDVRLDWGGTGSIPMIPKMIEKPGKYLIRFLLHFDTKSSRQFIETKDFEIEVLE